MVKFTECPLPAGAVCPFFNAAENAQRSPQRRDLGRDPSTKSSGDIIWPPVALSGKGEDHETALPNHLLNARAIANHVTG